MTLVTGTTPDMDHIADGYSLYSQGFAIGLNLKPIEGLLAKVRGNRDAAIPGGSRWHYNRGILAALELSDAQRENLRRSTRSRKGGTDMEGQLPNHIPGEIIQELRAMHPDPFVQAAVLRLFDQAPGLLATNANDRLSKAFCSASERISERAQHADSEVGLG